MTKRVPFVDAHQHFQDLDAHDYPWLCDLNAPPKLEGDLAAIRRNYLPADYRSDLAAVDLVKSVHIQNGWDPADPVGETRWLQALADRQGLPQAIIAYADLAAPDVAAVLEAHAACPNLRGIRQILNWHEEPIFRVAPSADLMDDPRWRRGFAALARHGLSFDLQIYWPQMDAALRLARAFPDTLILLNHMGMPIDRSAAGLASWAAAIGRLAAAPNVMIKISGLGLGQPRWTIEDTVPLIRRAIDLFGVTRAMFGTNLPVDRLFASGAAILAAYATAIQGGSDDERKSLFQTNAERAYRI